MGVPNPVFMIDWATYMSKHGGGVPKGAQQILEIKLMLTPELGGDDACLIATYLGTGRSESNRLLFEDIQSSEDHCGTMGFFNTGVGGRTVEEAFAAAKAHFKGAPGVYDALDAWSHKKATKAVMSAKTAYKEDTKKVYDAAGKVVAGVAAAAGFGAIAYFFGAAIVVYLITRASK